MPVLSERLLDFIPSRSGRLDRLVPAEIIGDEFYELLGQYAGDTRLKTFLDIGSSCGTGSTAAFAKTIRKRKDRSNVQLICMELSRVRYALLQETYSKDAFVHCYNMPSISAEKFPSEDEIVTFYRNCPSNLNLRPLSEVLEEYHEDKRHAQNKAHVSGIDYIKDHRNISRFDMVLIDGSQFTGKRETQSLLGAYVIALNGTETMRAMEAHQHLMDSKQYRLAAYDPSLRDGYAVYEHRRLGQLSS